METLILGDCLEKMKEIESGSVDCVICDLPYGTTACSWDTVIPFEPLWEQYKRIVKPRGAVVLFGSQPFTTDLIMSNREWFKYCWYWKKSTVGGFTSAKLKPLKIFEDICIFSEGKTANCNDNNMPYYPQGLKKIEKMTSSSTSKKGTGYARPSTIGSYVQTETNYPTQLLEFKNEQNINHPTQKPVGLCEYLIRTYTNEGETVLDNTMGSGTTGVACVHTKRNFIGIEKDETYFKIAQERIMNAQLPLI